MPGPLIPLRPELQHQLAWVEGQENAAVVVLPDGGLRVAGVVDDLLGRMPPPAKLAERAGHRGAERDMRGEGAVLKAVAARAADRGPCRGAHLRSEPQQRSRGAAGLVRDAQLVHGERNAPMMAGGQRRPDGIGDTEVIEEGKRMARLKHWPLRCECGIASCGVPVQRLAGSAADYQRAVPDDRPEQLAGHSVPCGCQFRPGAQRSVDKGLLYGSP